MECLYNCVIRLFFFIGLDGSTSLGFVVGGWLDFPHQRLDNVIQLGELRFLKMVQK